jgi:hypothetical protein
VKWRSVDDRLVTTLMACALDMLPLRKRDWKVAIRQSSGGRVVDGGERGAGTVAGCGKSARVASQSSPAWQSSAFALEHEGLVRRFAACASLERDSQPPCDAIQALCSWFGHCIAAVSLVAHCDLHC